MVLAMCVSVAQAGPTVVTLVQTNDMHGRVETDSPDQPAKGLVIIGSLVEQARKGAPDLLLFDCGDTLSGRPNSVVTRGRAILAAMNALGYDAMVMGNHEFDFGSESVKAALATAKFPILSANLIDESRDNEAWDPIQPYRVYTVRGVKVGVFGLTTINTMDFEYPGWIYPAKVVDPFKDAQQTVDHLRENEGVDLVVALTHIGYKVDRQLAENVKGIDVILGGHSHTFLEEPVWVGDTLIMQSGSYARAMGRIDILLDTKDSDGGGYKVVAYNGKDGRWWGHDGVPKPESQLGQEVQYPGAILVRPTADTPPHEGILAAYESYRPQVDEHLNERLAMIESRIGAEGHRKHETPMGNLLADAVRWSAGSDVGVYASSQFQPVSFEAGPINRHPLYRLITSYTRQHQVTVETGGEQLRAMLEAAVTPEGGVNLYISGAKLTPEIEMADGKAIDLSQRYIVAGAAHIMQDYMIGKPGVEILDDSTDARILREALAAYLKHLRLVSPPATDRLGLEAMPPVGASANESSGPAN